MKEPNNPGLKKLPKKVRNKMGYRMYGGTMEEMMYGGKMKKKRKKFEDGGKTPQSVGTFEEAFRQAKNSGVKTFMWKGKKYTTEMAKPKMKAVKSKNKNYPGPKKPGEMKKGGVMKRFTKGGFMQYD